MGESRRLPGGVGLSFLFFLSFFFSPPFSLLDLGREEGKKSLFQVAVLPPFSFLFFFFPSFFPFSG